MSYKNGISIKKAKKTETEIPVISGKGMSISGIKRAERESEVIKYKTAPTILKISISASFSVNK